MGVASMIDLLITPEQAEHIRTLSAEADKARGIAAMATSLRDHVVESAARGHGYSDVKAFELEGRTLRIQLPEAPREDA